MTSILNSAVLSPIGNCAIKAKQKHMHPPKIETKQSPQRLLHDCPLGWKLKEDSCEAASFREPCKVPHNVRDADIQIVHRWTRQCRAYSKGGAISKLPAKNKYPFARAFLNAQADPHSKSSSLLDTFKECFLIKASWLIRFLTRSPFIGNWTHLQCTVQTSAKSKLPSPAPSFVSKPI